MIHQLTSDIWFGDWQSPFECLGQVGGIINVAHHFSPRRGRSVYWSRLAELRHDVLYFRLSRKDREDVDEAYLWALESAKVLSRSLRPGLPILVHCQLGGHRGPSAALWLAWTDGYRTRAAFAELHQRALELVPSLARGRNYYRSLLAYIGERTK